MLESMSGWLTPTSLFLLLNVVIGTIWVTSHFGHNRSSPPHDGPHPQPSQPSIFQRVRSINFGLQRHDHHDGDGHHFPPAEQVYGDIAAHVPPSISRAPSILDRVRSVNFSDFQFSFLGSDQNQAKPGPGSDPNPVRDPVEGPDLRSRLLARAPSLLQRVKSITFTDLPQISLFRSEPSVAEIRHSDSEPLTDLDWGRFEEVLHGGDEHHARRTKSDLKKKAASSSAKKMKKSASEKIDLGKAAAEAAEETERRRPATTRVERTPSFGGDVEVDSKADDFINKFKNQLKLQRLNSFAQYRDMITRGASR